MGISARAYARQRKDAGLPGGSEGGVRKAIQTKRISTLPDGTIDPEVADREWARNTFAGQTLAKAAKAADSRPAESAAPAAALPQSSPEPVSQGADPVAAYLRARAVKENFAARKMQLEYEELAGKLIRAERASEYAASFSSIVKDSLLAVPDRLSPMLAALAGDEVAIHRLLMKEIADVLRKMSKAITDAGL